jgi:hypothetical protein
MAARTLRSIIIRSGNPPITERVPGIDAQGLADFKLAPRGLAGLSDGRSRTIDADDLDDSD